MLDLNYWLNAFLRLQLCCHGNDPVVVLLPDGSRAEIARVGHNGTENCVELKRVQ